jgi:multiple sugar transport system substrate-binding protein
MEKKGPEQKGGINALMREESPEYTQSEETAERRKAMRLYRWFAPIIVFAVLLVGINASQTSAATKKLRIWHMYTQQARIDDMKRTADEFEKATGISVEYDVMPWGTFTNRWPAAFASRSLPDGSTALAYDSLAVYIAGASLPADDLIQSMGGVEKFVPGLLDRFVKYQGHYTALPHYAYSHPLWYRKDWLREANLQPPRDWAELLTVTKAITNPEKKRYGMILPMNKGKDIGGSMYLSSIMMGGGAEFFDKDSNVHFNTPETIEAVKMFLKLYENASVPGALDYKFEQNNQLIRSGTAGFQLDTAMMIYYVDRDTPELAPSIGSMFFPPKQRGMPGTNIPSGNMLVTYKGPNVKETQQFFRFLFEKDRNVRFLHTLPCAMIPITREVASSQEFYSNPLIQKYKDHLELATRGLEIGYGIGMKYGVNPYAPLVTSGILEEMLHSIIMDKVPIEKAVADFDARLRKLVDEQRRAMKK